MILLACKPKKRATRRWITERLRAFTPSAFPDAHVRSTVARWTETLQQEEIVEVERAHGQIVALTLTSKAGRRWIWHRLSGLATRATTPTLTVEEMATVTGKGPRMVWRWFSGEYVPKAETLARLWLHYADQAPESAKAKLRARYGQEAPVALSFLHALEANLVWSARFLAGCQVTPAEARRALNWIVREHRPIAEFCGELLTRENAALAEAIKQSRRTLQ